MTTRFATRRRERIEVSSIAHATGGDYLHAAPADVFVETDIGSAHGAVAIDRGDMELSSRRPRRTVRAALSTSSPLDSVQPRTSSFPLRTSMATTSCSPSVWTNLSSDDSSAQTAVPMITRAAPAAKTCKGRVNGSNAARHLEWDRSSDARAHRAMTSGRIAPSRAPWRSTIWIRGGSVATMRAMNDSMGWRKMHAIEIAVFETDGVVAEEIESGDYLHSSVLAC